VNQVDLDVGKISGNEFKKVTTVLKANTNISRFTIKGTKLNRALKDELKNEIDKNKSIYNVIHPNICENKVSLNLKDKGLKDIGFVSKYISENSNIQRLILSHN
jgi:hypothetical protein